MLLLLTSQSNRWLKKVLDGHYLKYVKKIIKNKRVSDTIIKETLTLTLRK